MSEDALRPLIILHVPERHEIDPQALGDLHAYAETRYGASLLVNPRRQPRGAPPPILLGHWGHHLPGQVHADLQPHIERVFFNLDWLGLEDAM